MLALAKASQELEESLMYSVLSLLSNTSFEFAPEYFGMNSATQRVLVFRLVEHVISLDASNVNADEVNDEVNDEDGEGDDEVHEEEGDGGDGGDVSEDY